MTVARLHRRLAALMALAALGALAAGASVTPGILVVTAALLVGQFWTPGGRLAWLVENGSKLLAVAIFVWVLYLGLIAGGDVLESGIALLFVLLAGESLRPLQAKNDFRLYSLSFALVIAATAYYPGVAFGVAFTGYIVLATLALMVGHLRRQAEHFRIPDLRIDRSFLFLTAALSLITLLASVVIFISFPRMPRSWFGQGRTPGGSMAGFSDVVSLGDHGGRLQANPEVMFRVEFVGDDPPPDPAGLYWRGLSFHQFDGTRWSRDRYGRRADYQGRVQMALGAAWGDDRLEYRIFGGPPGVRVLFGSSPVLGVRPHSAIQPRIQWNGDFEYAGWDVPVYSVMSGASRPPDERLRAVAAGVLSDSALYLQLPPLEPRVAALADSLTRPHPTRIGQVRAVESWLRREFRYTLDLPRNPSEASLENFLFVRRAGHCEYFSTALAILLRSAGIPARNVNGFLGGEWNERGEYLAVTGNNAHSWVEAWFPGIGWVPFDGTPAGDRDEMLLSAGSSAIWPVLFWFDAVQFKWYQWVLAYDLDRQLDLFHSLGDRFSSPSSPFFGRGSLPWRESLPWLLGALGAAGALWLTARTRSRSRRAETRYYLALRQRYERAGYPVRSSDGPLDFVKILRHENAPGADEAEWLVGRYVRARFAGEALGADDRKDMKSRLLAVRRSLRGKPSNRQQGTSGGRGRLRWPRGWPDRP